LSFIATADNLTPAYWFPVGNFPLEYTAVTSHIDTSLNILDFQIIVGFSNGIIEYGVEVGSTAPTWENIPSPVQEGGTAVTALFCNWSNTYAGGCNNLLDILVGYANGSVWYYKADKDGSGTWNLVCTPNSTEQVIKFGAVSIDSSGDICSFNVETAIVPIVSSTPLDYTNKQLYHWNDNFGTFCVLGLYNTNISTIDVDNGDCGLTNGDIQQEGGYNATSSGYVGSITTTAFLGDDNGIPEYFWGDTDGVYGIGHFTNLTTFTGLQSGKNLFNGYSLISVSPSVNGNQNVLVASQGQDLQFFNISHTYAAFSVGSTYYFPQAIGIKSRINGLYVYWNGITPAIIVVGLNNGDIITGATNSSGNPVYYAYHGLGDVGQALPVFNGKSQIFANATPPFENFSYVTVGGIFNSDNHCYIYMTNFLL